MKLLHKVSKPHNRQAERLHVAQYLHSAKTPVTKS